MIYLAIIDLDGPEARASALAELLTTAGIPDTAFKGLDRHDSGKPFLKLDPPRPCGYSLSKFRHDGVISAVVALSPEQDIGVDAEFWPKRHVEPEFLDSIASPEDQRAIQLLERLRHDTATALWTIKEAGLKCCGTVMTEPSHVAVTPAAQGWWRVASSSLAGSPIPEMSVRLLSVWNEQRPEAKILLALAVLYEKRPQIQILTGRWTYSALVT